MKKTSYIFCILLVASAISINAQAQSWVGLGKLIVGMDTVTGVNEIKNFGADMYISTNKGLFKSIDNGANWTNLTWTKPTVASKNISAAVVDSASGNIYAVADSSIYKSTDGGATWNGTVVNGTLKGIQDLFIMGPNVLIAYSNSQGEGVMYSTNGLTSVQAATTPSKEFIKIIRVGTDLFASGKDGVYKSTDSGLSWAQAGAAITGGRFGSIVYQGNRFFIGDFWATGMNGSTDYGTTWPKVDTAVFNAFCQVFDIASTGGVVLATMDGACNNATPLKWSMDTGKTWVSAMQNIPDAFYNILGANQITKCFFAFSPNSDSLYRVCMQPSAVKNIDKELVSIAPNPAHSYIEISSSTNEKLNYYFTTMDGRKLRADQPLSSGATRVDISSFTSGLYFLIIENKDARQAYKVIKK